ncbi:hypothetical protein PVA17_21990 [Lysinibacillus sp. CNPSo 3705]|uniref:hypothetical protein n=1 Tax=Lysinibacillus sp. CNPSo 3705 TaxID=3028148 RepID=UPI0023638092|nr:hypothetical protein [Lysinibacillus sp. CNPSo 3705]MDD1505396.1 hypothetical protein [Lysinibacillus sp. CNPSo 3705]
MKVTIKEINVFRFPQHSAEIDILPSEEKSKMDTLVEEIANSFVNGTSPIVAYIIVGHADNDPQGSDFEMQVSISRAEAAKEWLIKQGKIRVQQLGGDPSELDYAEFSLFGYGASDPYTQVQTFPEREMNRRIVIKYAAVEIDPPIGAIGFLPNLTRATTLMQLQPTDDRITRIRCALAKLVDPATDDTYFDWIELSKVDGSLKGKDEQQILALAKSIIRSLRRDIANNNLYGFPFVPDDVVIQNLLQWEENIRNTKNKLYQREVAEGIGAGPVHKSAGRYIVRNQDNPNSILSCFKNT